MNKNPQVTLQLRDEIMGFYCDIECSVCGIPLEYVQDDWSNRMLTIRVNPCPKCSKAGDKQVELESDQVQPEDEHKPQGIFIRCERCGFWQKREQFKPWPQGWVDIKNEILCPNCAAGKASNR